MYARARARKALPFSLHNLQGVEAFGLPTEKWHWEVVQKNSFKKSRDTVPLKDLTDGGVDGLDLLNGGGRLRLIGSRLNNGHLLLILHRHGLAQWPALLLRGEYALGYNNFNNLVALTRWWLPN